MSEKNMHQMPGDPVFSVYTCLKCGGPVPMSRMESNPEYCSALCESTKKSCGHPTGDLNPADRPSCYYCVGGTHEVPDFSMDQYVKLREIQAMGKDQIELEMNRFMQELLKDGDDRLNDHATATGMYDHDDES